MQNNYHLIVDKPSRKSKFTLFFNHISHLIKKIYRIDKLENSHIYNFYYESTCPTEEIFSYFENQNQNEEKKDLLSKLKKKFKIQFILVGLLRFLTNLLLFSGPIFLDLLTENYKIFTDSKDENEISHAKKINLIYSLSLACCFIIYSFLETQYSWYLNKLEVNLRIAMQFLLYKKGFNIRGFDSKKSEENANFTNILTIDIENVLNFIQSFHQTWSQILNLIIGLVLLYFKMQSAVFLGFFAVLFLVILNFQIAKKIGSVYGDMMKYKDERMSLLQDIFSGIRQIKYLTWESIFEEKILKIREKEFHCLQVIKYLDAFCVFFWATTTIVISTLSFLFYDILGDNLKEVNIFTTIALFNILIFPLNALPWTIAGMLMGRISFQRVNKYFLEKEIEKNEQDNILQDNKENAIYINNMEWNWPNDNDSEKFKLKKIYLEIKKGEFCMIIGQVGSGKTALFNAFLNEMEKNLSENELKESKFMLNGKIAYVSQNNWIQNQSIRENILFGNEFNCNFYKECINNCELEQDLLNNAEGDLQDVGSEGFCLSGGQKQRISLCRALYQNADIYLFDDIFSSVDSEVANRIFEKCVLNLKEKGKTILMILSQYRFLKFADTKYLLKNGEIISNNEEIQNYLEKIPNIDNNIKEEKPNQDKKLDNFKKYKKINEVKKSNEIETPFFNNSEFSKEKENELKKTTVSVFVEKEKKNEEIREEGSIKLNSILVYIKGMGLFFLILILITMFGMQFFRNFFDIWLKSYVNSDPIFFFESNFRETIIILAVISIIATLFRAFVFAIANLKASKTIFKKLLNKVIFSQMTFFESNAIGRIINRFSADTQAIDDRISFESNILLNNIFILFGSIVVIVLQNYYIIISMAVISILFIKIQQNYRVSSRELKRLDAVNGSKVLTHISETASGIKIIRAHEKNNFFISDFKKKISDSSCSSFLIKAISCWLSIRLQFLSTIITTSILIISVIFLYMDNYPNPNSFALSLTYALSITSLLKDLIMSLTSTERECIGIERIHQYLKNRTEKEIQEPNKNNKINLVSNIVFESNNTVIEFSNVSLRYDKTQPIYAIKNISFKLNKNEKIAFCGRTGCGKTSILNALFRLYPIESNGSISFKNKNILNIPLHELRSMMSVVPQMGFLFNGSIKENIDPKNEFNDELLELKWKETKLNFKEFQENESDIKSFKVENGGRNLSNGERQIVNFLRVLLRNTEIICLDEATSNLDPHTDEIVTELIKNINDKTIILITHRIQTLEHFDKIFVMNEGSIVEEGNFETLTKNENSMFNFFIRELNN